MFTLFFILVLPQKVVYLLVWYINLQSKPKNESIPLF